LPRAGQFNDGGFLHAYICYVAEDVCLLLISVKQEVFHELQTCKESIVSTLLSHSERPLEAVQAAIRGSDSQSASDTSNSIGSAASSSSAISSPPQTHGHPTQATAADDGVEAPFVPKWTAWSSYGAAELQIPSLRHFIYKQKATCQITHPRFEAPYATRKEQKRLFRLYQMVHRRVHRFKKAHKVYYQVSEHETCIAWTTAGFELFAVFSPIEDKAVCIESCNAILRWIKSEENSLFILNSPVWS
jgi:vacuolar fusion protein MON1